MQEIFNDILNTFENEDIKEFAEKCIESAPEYWHHVPASSTGKYHPSYSLGEGGLVRHTIGVVRLLNHMFGVESIANQFTSRERDLLRVAAITHDCKKSGSQEDYEKSKYTKFNHPLLAANFIRSLKDDYVGNKEREFVAHAIESHMGAFNTDKRHPDIILPKPQDKYQIILHLADYLASRKDIELKFDDIPQAEPEPLPDPNTWKLNFGKYKGQLLKDVIDLHPDYIEWLQRLDGFHNEPCRSLLVQLGYEFK